MPLNKIKHLMTQGGYTKGYQLSVTSAPANYLLHVSHVDKGFAVSSILMLPTNSGDGDYITVSHYKDTGTGDLVRTLADTIYNPGPNTPFKLDLPTIEKFGVSEDLRITYTNVGTKDLTVNVYVDFVK